MRELEPGFTQGADSARPSRYLQLYKVIKRSNRCRLMLCLASMSAGLHSPSTLRRSTRLVRTACWIQSVCVCVEVSKFAEPLTGADPDCGAGVGPHAQGQFDADVLEQCLIPKALTGSSDHTGKFRFA